VGRRQEVQVHYRLHSRPHLVVEVGGQVTLARHDEHDEHDEHDGAEVRAAEGEADRREVLDPVQVPDAPVAAGPRKMA